MKVKGIIISIASIVVVFVIAILSNKSVSDSRTEDEELYQKIVAIENGYNVIPSYASPTSSLSGTNNYGTSSLDPEIRIGKSIGQGISRSILNQFGSPNDSVNNTGVDQIEEDSNVSEIQNTSFTTLGENSYFDVSTISPYSGDASIPINNNMPWFTKDNITTSSYEYYGDLDSLGRCTVAYGCIGQDLMPTEERGEIGMVKPSGWHTVKYPDLIEDKYLYNRCHLLMYALTGENANEKNLITGTRYLNISGMLPYEDSVLEYIRQTGNHVLYRVTPVFIENELVARGVLMEAYSVEDSGTGICFCSFCYNVQPGITIDYSTGDSMPT